MSKPNLLAVTLLLITAGLALAPPGAAHPMDQSDCLADPIFLETFEQESGGGPRSTLSNWDVLSGTVDVVGDGTPWPTIQPGDGHQLDLDGSNAGAHIATKSTLLTNMPAGKYLLRFELGGNDRARPADTVEVRLTNLDTSTVIDALDLTLASADPMTFYTRGFSLPVDASLQVSFHNLGGDSYGAVLDDVLVCATDETFHPLPELSSALLGLVGMGLLGAIALGWNGVLRRS